MADGRLFAAGEGSGAQFDSVYTPNTARYWGWYAELDAATGKGKSVKAFGGTTANSPRSGLRRRPPSKEHPWWA